jgi:hypothetical protein
MAPDLVSADALATVAATLRIDLQAAEVISAFAAAETPCIVLKGRAFAELLYPNEARAYDDTDLLVPARLVARAEGALRALGYEQRALTKGVVRSASPHARHWDRPRDAAHVDLHERLDGSLAEADSVWGVLAPRTVELIVGGQRARALDRSASGMLCALHLAAHGRGAKPEEDLARALTVLSPAEWRTARAIAVTLVAEEAFIAGLRSSPAGADLADELGLPRALSPHRLLRADPTTPSGAHVIETLVSSSSASEIARALWVVMFPAVTEMRRHHPLARRGRAGLISCYAARPLRLIALLPEALQAWARARAASGRRAR